MRNKLIKNNLGFVPPDDWYVEKIGDFADVKVGRDLKEDRFNELKNRDYKYPVYSNTVENYGLYGFYSKPEYSRKSVTVVGRGAGVGTAFEREEPFGAIGRLLILIPNGKVNSNYLKLFINDRIRFYNESTGVPQLTGVQIKTYFIAYPPKQEQEKIAQILSTWDEAISKTEKLIQAKKRYKKGLMQRLLSPSTSGQASKLRFPEFEGEDWVEAKLGSLLKEVRRMDDWNDEKLYELISVRRRSGGIFHREKLYGHEIKTKNLKEVKTGDFLISRMQIVHGASAVVTPEFENLFVSNSYHTLVKRKGVELNMSFLNYLSQLPYFYHLTYISSYGVHIEKMTFNLKHFLKKKVRIPKTEAEQYKIASVLQQADKEIDLLKEQKQNFEKQKKGLMQKLLTGKVRVK